MQEISVFEKIIDGSIPCYRVYEDASVLAFLSLEQKSKGHTLVVPKVHSRNMLDISEIDLLQTMSVVQKLTKHLFKKLNASGFKIQQNNEVSAGQEVFHTHFHIIPYYNSVSCENNTHNTLSKDELLILSREIYLE